jgi:hypothetical protein
MFHGEPGQREIRRLAERERKSESLSGFKSAVLAYHPGTIRHLLATNPHFRVLIGLRDPVQWAWSWYWFRRRNVEDACRPEGPQTPIGKVLLTSRAFDLGKLREITALDFIQADVAYALETRRHGRFEVFLDEIYRCLPAEQILLVDVSELELNWKRVIRGCLGFVGLDARVPRRIHGNINERKPSTGMDSSFEASAFEYYRDSYTQISRLLAARGYIELSQLFSQRARDWSLRCNRGGTSAA